MNLIDKEDDIALILHLFNEALDTALKLAAELRARDKSREVKKMYFLVGEFCRHVTRCYAKRKALGNGRLTYAGFTYKAGIVL